MTFLCVLVGLVVCVVPSPRVWGEQCLNPPPGVRKMLRGVDLTSLDLVPLTHIAGMGVKGAVISLSCDQGRKWVSPDGTEYQQPDQVSLVTTIPGGWLAAKTSLYETSQDIRDSLTSNLEVEGDVKKYALSASSSYMSLQNSITNQSNYVSDVSAFDAATRVDFVPYWELKLNPHAQQYAAKWLTGSFESNPEKYRRFIKEYGTHYFQSGNFGGFIRVLEEISSQYFNSHSESEIEANVEGSYLEIISAKGGTVAGSTKVDEEYRKETSQTVKYFGGDTNLLSGDGLQAWQPTVDHDPWLFAGTLRPISDLIQDKDRRESLARAVTDHVLRRYVEELERLVNARKFRSSDPVLTTLLTKIVAMKRVAILAESDVDVLARDVTHQVTVPRWFTQNTQLCQSWKPDGSRSQCGGDADRLLCAAPNSMTPYYRDDTDYRSGGCEMQWGIQSRGQPQWFDSVLICFRYYSDGNGNQCGGGSDLTVCSNANTFSRAYRDDTDYRSGGCNMSWSLRVPKSAPVWLREAKMCFAWVSEGVAGQCGNAPHGNVCAAANKWTPYYRDDTDWRNGGCLLSWGIMLD